MTVEAEKNRPALPRLGRPRRGLAHAAWRRLTALQVLAADCFSTASGTFVAMPLDASNPGAAPGAAAPVEPTGRPAKTL